MAGRWWTRLSAGWKAHLALFAGAAIGVVAVVLFDAVSGWFLAFVVAWGFVLAATAVGDRWFELRSEWDDEPDRYGQYI